MHIPPDVIRAVGKLEERGHQAYLVGGSLRDLIVGVPANDWDIACSALPEMVREVFGGHRVIDTGIRHGTLQVKLEENLVEITSFRSDGEYLDHRHPVKVTYVTTIEEDLARRDFTMNAIAFNPKTGFIDPYGGESDIKARTIRSVGSPGVRLGEDALRIMRALRLSSSLGFKIETSLSDSLHASRYLLKSIAVERVSEELLKMLVGDNILPVLLAYPDVLSVVIPEIEPTIGFDQKSRFHQYDVWEHTARAVEAAIQKPVVRLTLLMHDLGKPACFLVDGEGEGHFYGHDKRGEELAQYRLRELRFDNVTIYTVSQLIRYHQLRLKPENVKKWLARLGEEFLRLLIEVRRGDILAHCDSIKEEALSDLFASEARLDEIIEKGDCVRLSDLAVSGDDLLEIGFEEGKLIGETLLYLLGAVIKEELENNKEVLLAAARTYFQQARHTSNIGNAI